MIERLEKKMAILEAQKENTIEKLEKKIAILEAQKDKLLSDLQSHSSVSCRKYSQLACLCSI